MANHLSELMTKKFHVIIEKDEDGGFIGKVAELKGCLSQGDSLDELMTNVKEAIELCLEVQKDELSDITLDFVGVQEVEV